MTASALVNICWKVVQGLTARAARIMFGIQLLLQKSTKKSLLGVALGTPGLPLEASWAPKITTWGGSGLRWAPLGTSRTPPGTQIPKIISKMNGTDIVLGHVWDTFEAGFLGHVGTRFDGFGTRWDTF